MIDRQIAMFMKCILMVIDLMDWFGIKVKSFLLFGMETITPLLEEIDFIGLL